MTPTPESTRMMMDWLYERQREQIIQEMAAELVADFEGFLKWIAEQDH